jgi:DNA-binding response OmpR family regulator
MSQNPLAETVHLGGALERPQADPTGPALRKTPEGLPSRRSIRVLIVDDEPQVADSLSAVVSSWGHDVRRVYDAISGLAEAGQHLPNVVLLDIAMPGMDGHELARQLRLHAGLKGCYLLAMRAGNDDRGGWGADIDLFLAKPMNLSVLETLLLMEGERLDRLEAHQRAVS